MKIEDLTLEERETVLSMVADDRDTFHVFSDDPVMMARLERIGATLVKTEAYGGKHYTLRADQVLLRKGKPKRGPLSDAQRAALARSPSRRTKDGNERAATQRVAQVDRGVETQTGR